MLFRSNDTATTEIYTQQDTLSLHDALPISGIDLGPACAAVIQVGQHLEGVPQDLVRFASLDIDHEADAAGVVLLAGIVEAGGAGRRNGHSPTVIAGPESEVKYNVRIECMRFANARPMRVASRWDKRDATIAALVPLEVFPYRTGNFHSLEACSIIAAYRCTTSNF